MGTMAAPGVQKIPRKTLATLVASQIRARIFDGTFPPGMRLDEVDLAEQFDTSRGPIREGMQRLIQEGLLRGQAHRGVFVPVLTERDLKDIYLAREAVECTAVRVILGRGTSKQLLVDLKAIVGRMTDAVGANDWTKVANLDLEFHECLVQAAHSERLDRMFSTLMAETRLCLALLASDYVGRQDLVAEHTELTKLLASENRDAALATLSAHFEAAIVTLSQEEAV